MIRTLIGRWLTLSLMMLGTLGATSARADWLRAESPLFVVYSDGKPDELKQFVSELQEYDALLRLLTGTTAAPSPHKLPIYLVRNARQLREVSPRAQQDIAGFYNSTPSGTLAVALRQDVGGGALRNSKRPLPGRPRRRRRLPTPAHGQRLDAGGSRHRLRGGVLLCVHSDLHARLKEVG